MSKVNQFSVGMPEIVTFRETRTPKVMLHSAARPMKKTRIRERNNEGTDQEKETRPGR